MNRRELITLIGSAGATASVCRSVPLHAQDRTRQISVLMGIADDQEGQKRVAAFRQGLREVGWAEGRNVGFQYRWGAGDVDNIRAQATQLIALRPDLVLANSTIVATVLKQATQTIPIVFVQVADPVRDGLVKSLAHPGGNITGFTSFEYAMGGKWLRY